MFLVAPLPVVRPTAFGVTNFHVCSFRIHCSRVNSSITEMARLVSDSEGDLPDISTIIKEPHLRSNGGSSNRATRLNEVSSSSTPLKQVPEAIAQEDILVNTNHCDAVETTDKQ